MSIFQETLDKPASRGIGGGRRNKFSKFYEALASGQVQPREKLPEEPIETTTRPSTIARTEPNYSYDFGVDPRYLENLDPRALAPIESTFEYDFEGFDPAKMARDDPIFQETMNKMTNLTISLNQINNFGRGDFKSRVLRKS